MFGSPVNLHDFLRQRDVVDEIYESLSKPDMADPVMTVLDILRKTKQTPPVVKESKSDSKSTAFRNEGNQAYGAKKYQKALICYNKALLFAPKNSRAMKLAYSNRSALLHKIKAFRACLVDIDICFSMGCPSDIVEKLRKRSDEARGGLWIERLTEESRYSSFCEEFFLPEGHYNPQITCATTQVGVIVENNIPTIVAATDVRVGTVLAVEKAFVSKNDPQNAAYTCYYCQRMDLNLKPCDGCVFALFCSETCRELCLKEYHNVECQIIAVLEAMSTKTRTRLGVKAVLKMKNSSSWKELNTASQVMGIARIKDSSINEIFDSNNKFSLLNVRDERHFLHGPMYNACFTSAAVIHYLEDVPCYLPQSLNEKNEAKRCLARLLMFLTIYNTSTQIISSVTINQLEKTELHDVPNYGHFSLIGKLRNSCTANVLALGLNNRIALIALTPIKRGTEITISYAGHWLETPLDKEIRQLNLQMMYGIVCNCIICTEEFLQCSHGTLTDMQRKNYRKLNIKDMRDNFNPRNISEYFSKLSKCLAFLSDHPFSVEYQNVFDMFRQCLLYIQDCNCDNIMLSYT